MSRIWLMELYLLAGFALVLHVGRLLPKSVPIVDVEIPVVSLRNQ